MWNLRDCDEKEYNAAEIKRRLEGLFGKIEGMQYIQVGKNVAAKGYDLCLYSEFDSYDAVLAYREHPLHKEVQKFVHSVISERVSCDFEV